MSDSAANGGVDEAARPQRAADLLTVEADGELLLLDPRTDGLHQLNPTATLIWSILDGDASVRELVDDLADAFETDAEVVLDDVATLLQRLESAGLLDGTSPPEYLLHGGDHDHGHQPNDDDGLWRPTYLIDPPAP